MRKAEVKEWKTQKQKLEAKKDTADEKDKPVTEKKSKNKVVEEREYIMPAY
jgi:hypothetical protein